MIIPSIYDVRTYTKLLFTIVRPIGILPNFEEKEDNVVQQGEHDFPRFEWGSMRGRMTRKWEEIVVSHEP